MVIKMKMENNQNNFGEQTYYDKGILNKEDVTPFHAGMESTVSIRIPVEGDSASRGVLNELESEVFNSIVKKMSDTRQPISREDIMKNPHSYGTMKNGKFVSFIDEFNESKGIKTDREQGNSFKKNKPIKPTTPNISGAMGALGKRGVR